MHDCAYARWVCEREMMYVGRGWGRGGELLVETHTINSLEIWGETGGLYISMCSQAGTKVCVAGARIHSCNTFGRVVSTNCLSYQEVQAFESSVALPVTE